MQTPAQEEPRTRRKALRVSPLAPAAVAYFIYFTAAGAGWPYLPVYYQTLGLDLATIGGLAALAAAVQLVAAPAWGALNDRFGSSRWVLPAAPILAAAAALALAGVRVLPAIAICVVLLYAGLSGIAPMLDARTLSVLGMDRMRFGRVRAWGSVSFVLAAWLVGILIDQTSPRGLFVVYVPCLLLTAVATMAIPRRTLVHLSGMFRGGLALLRQRDLTLFLLASLLVWMAFSAADSFYSLYVVSVGGSAQAVGLVWALESGVEAAFMWSFPVLAGRFGAGRLLVAGAALFALRAALAAIFATVPALIVIPAAEGIAYGIFFIASVTHVARLAPPNLSATAQGLYSATAGLARVVGSSVGGLLAEAVSLRGLYAACAVGGLLATLAVWSVLRGRFQTGNGSVYEEPAA